MVERVAVKILSASDLTFFEMHHKTSQVGNQKSINLNADVFCKKLYPALIDRARGEDIEIPVSVTVYGPAGGPAYRFPRSITRKGSYKNWRLNGAAVPDPEGEPGRFDILQERDVVVIEFSGESQPTAVTMILVSATVDPALAGALIREAGVGSDSRKSMFQLTKLRLSQLADESATPAEHPLRLLLSDPDLEEELEDAAYGNEAALRQLRSRPHRPISKTDLLKARENADRVGFEGEELAWHALKEQQARGELRDVVWTASAYAAAAWDFEVKMPDGRRVLIDAKSTTGAFGRKLHVSAAEIAAAASGEEYRILRVFELDEAGARMSLSEPVVGLAKEIVKAAAGMPAGVAPDSFSVDPVALNWDEPFVVRRPDQPE